MAALRRTWSAGNLQVPFAVEEHTVLEVWTQDVLDRWTEDVRVAAPIPDDAGIDEHRCDEGFLFLWLLLLSLQLGNTADERVGRGGSKGLSKRRRSGEASGPFYGSCCRCRGGGGGVSSNQGISAEADGLPGAIAGHAVQPQECSGAVHRTGRRVTPEPSQYIMLWPFTVWFCAQGRRTQKKGEEIACSYGRLYKC